MRPNGCTMRTLSTKVARVNEPKLETIAHVNLAQAQCPHKEEAHTRQNVPGNRRELAERVFDRVKKPIFSYVRLMRVNRDSNTIQIRTEKPTAQKRSYGLFERSSNMFCAPLAEITHDIQGKSQRSQVPRPRSHLWDFHWTSWYVSGITLEINGRFLQKRSVQDVSDVQLEEFSQTSSG